MADQGKPQGILTTTPAQNPTIKVVAIGNDKLDPEDKKVLCSAICHCHYQPHKGKNDQNLYQSCVSARLKELDLFLGHRSPWKPELTYDMTESPPKPVTDKNIATKAHDYVWGWIKKNWLKDKGYEYEKGEGMTRRPDVVIVKDPTKPPTQDNIKYVVEIKLGDDEFGTEQRKSYAEVAGDKSKVKVLDPDSCECGNDDEDGKKSTVTEFVTWAAGIASALYSLRKGKIPKFPKFPSPKPTPSPAW